MGEESGVPVGLLLFGYYYYYFFRVAKKENVNEEEGIYMAVLFTSTRK